MNRKPDAKRALATWLRLSESMRAEGVSKAERDELPADAAPCSTSDLAARDRFDKAFAAALVRLIDDTPEHQAGAVSYAANGAAIMFGAMVGLAHDGPCLCANERAVNLARFFMAGFGAAVSGDLAQYERSDA